MICRLVTLPSGVNDCVVGCSRARHLALPEGLNTDSNFPEEEGRWVFCFHFSLWAAASAEQLTCDLLLDWETKEKGGREGRHGGESAAWMCPPLNACRASSSTTANLAAQRSHFSIFGAAMFIFEIRSGAAARCLCIKG